MGARSTAPGPGAAPESISAFPASGRGDHGPDRHQRAKTGRRFGHRPLPIAGVADPLQPAVELLADAPGLDAVGPAAERRQLSCDARGDLGDQLPGPFVAGVGDALEDRLQIVQRPHGSLHPRPPQTSDDTYGWRPALACRALNETFGTFRTIQKT